MKLVMNSIPFWDTVKNYRIEFFKKDIVAAITVATVLIPQAMAYALLAGVPPIYGLYAAFIGSAIGSLWGSSPYLATGPVAVVSFLSAATVASFSPNTTEALS